MGIDAIINIVPLTQCVEKYILSTKKFNIRGLSWVSMVKVQDVDTILKIHIGPPVKVLVEHAAIAGKWQQRWPGWASR